MKRVILEVDWYAKVILTLIAVLLAGILAKPYTVTNPVRAGLFGDNVIVNNRRTDPVPVEIVKSCQISTSSSNQRGVLIVVDWKEREAYYQYLKKSWGS